ncbi:hypothetical protein A616_06270 [Brevibacillus brevis X23]|nr:hypothetical protein A616_06270 [Brevibacillus brevis X23]
MDREQKRQINALVAGALGYEIISGEVDNVNPLYNNGHRLKEMDFARSWAWMGVMVEEARKQGVRIEFASRPNEEFRVWVYKNELFDYVVCDSDSLPMAACLALLKAKDIYVA